MDSYRREKGLPVPGVDAPAAPASVKEAEEEGEEGGCPVECVKEIFTDAEFDDIISKAPADQLLVFDFWKTACGACR